MLLQYISFPSLRRVRKEERERMQSRNGVRIIIPSKIRRQGLLPASRIWLLIFHVQGFINCFRIWMLSLHVPSNNRKLQKCLITGRSMYFTFYHVSLLKILYQKIQISNNHKKDVLKRKHVVTMYRNRGKNSYFLFKVEKWRERPTIWEVSMRVPKLVKERMSACF